MGSRERKEKVKNLTAVNGFTCRKTKSIDGGRISPNREVRRRLSIRNFTRLYSIRRCD